MRLPGLQWHFQLNNRCLARPRLTNKVLVPTCAFSGCQPVSCLVVFVFAPPVPDEQGTCAYMCIQLQVFAPPVPDAPGSWMGGWTSLTSFEELHLRLNRPASGGRDTVMARTPATCVQVAYHVGCHASRRAGFAHRRSRPAGLVDLPAFGGNSSNECKRKRPPEETWSIATPMEDVSPVSDYDTGDEDDIVMTKEQEALYDIKNELFNLSCEFALKKLEFSRCKLHEEEAVAHAASLWRHEHSELQREKERVIKMQSDVQESVLQRQLEDSALSLLFWKSLSLQREVNDLEQKHLAEEQRLSILQQQTRELAATIQREESSVSHWRQERLAAFAEVQQAKAYRQGVQQDIVSAEAYLNAVRKETRMWKQIEADKKTTTVDMPADFVPVVTAPPAGFAPAAATQVAAAPATQVATATTAFAPAAGGEQLQPDSDIWETCFSGQYQRPYYYCRRLNISTWDIPVPVVNPPAEQPPWPWGTQVPQEGDAQPPVHQPRPQGFLYKAEAQLLGAKWATGYPACLGYGRPLAAGCSRVAYPGPPGWVYKVANDQKSNLPDVDGYRELPFLCPVATEVGTFPIGHLNLHVIAQEKCDHTLFQEIRAGRPPALEIVRDVGIRIGRAMKEGWHVGDVHAGNWGQLPTGMWCLLDAGCVSRGKSKIGDAVKSFSRSLELFPDITRAFDQGCRE